jgi:hypothetical protein
MTTEQPAMPATPTAAVLRALAAAQDQSVWADLMFLERWERDPWPGSAAALRINQIRRANPTLAAEVRAELHLGRPLTAEERQRLLS